MRQSATEWVRVLIFAVCLGAVVGSANLAWADDLADGVAAYTRRDYATALKIWQPLADQGDSDAQFNIGLMYEHGDGVAQEYKEAARWFRAAAEQGLADAQNNLGSLYLNGHGLEVIAHPPTVRLTRSA